MCGNFHKTITPGWVVGIRYINGPNTDTETIHQIFRTWPSVNRECFHLCRLSMQGGGYNFPNEAESTWTRFGFCACRQGNYDNHAQEAELARAYRQLVESCTFEEIYSAYDSSTMYALLKSKVAMPASSCLCGNLAVTKDLEDILNQAPHGIKSVCKYI
jgi:hypothetical protein